MADVLHSALTGADLHESKGAATASLGQVAVATGTGSAVFNTLSYAFLSGTPIVPGYFFNGVAGTTPRIEVYTVNATSGIWTIPISGFTVVHAVRPTVVSSSNAIGAVAVATLNTFTNVSASGAVVLLGASGNALGAAQAVQVVVFGV